jgi:murein DD-endopeptidase MepM/ murein hydrolase activator NlpD
LNSKDIGAAQGLQTFAQKHRTSLVVAAVVGMVGSAMTAVAVAPLVSEAPIAQRLVSESVQPKDLGSQLGELAASDITLNRNEITRATDSAESLLKRLGVLDTSAVAFIRNDATARQLLAGRGGKMVQAQFDTDGRLQQLVARFPSDRPEIAKTHFSRLTLARIGGRWQAHTSTAAYGTQMRLGSGKVRSNLYAATDAAGLPDTVAEQLTEIFATDIDFHRELRQGDTFSVVYEGLTADGEPVAWAEAAGRVTAAEFINDGKTHQAIWFSTPDGRSGYYSADGRSKKRAFLASPMEFSRITSGFAGRINPFTKTWQRHQGIDYGAPTGTAVRAVAGGIVDFAGWKNGYGNAVEIDHGGGRTTFYAHLSRIDLRKGQRAEQGQRVGAVGSTGMATGPHLHFEFRVGGTYQDPQRVAGVTDTTPLEGSAKLRFKEAVRTVQARLDVAETLASRQPRIE